MFKIRATEVYSRWLQSQTLKTQAQVQTRLQRIIEYGHFGEARHLSPRLSELKWRNGLRVYFAITCDENHKILILLIGGNKSSQKQDIQKAKTLIAQMTEGNQNEKV